MKRTTTAAAVALIAGFASLLPTGPSRASTNQPSTNQPRMHLASTSQASTNQPSTNQPSTNQPSAGQAGAGQGGVRSRGAAAPVSCPLAWTKATGNAAFPDTSATYWTVKFPVVSGGYLTVAGTFPHARYMSFNSYQGAAAYDVVEDDILAPDNGAPNPFQGGNPRSNTVTYGLTVAFGPVQTPRAPNTLYTGPATPPANEIIYRVYVPDQGQDDTGGVGLPAVTYNAPAGTQPPPQCQPPAQPTVKPTVTGSPAAATGSPAAAIVQPTATIRPTIQPAAATNPLTWTKATGNSSYGNLDNAYLGASISLKFGQVLVIRAKAPSFPATYQGEPTFQGGKQLRYWSFCENNPLTTGVIGCSPDYLSNVPSGGSYTIVISRTKPTNIGPSCDDAWVPWGAVRTGTLLLRNMLPATSFTHSIQDAQNGQLQQDMGAYYPASAYVATVKQFENLGCPPNLSKLHFR